MRHTPPRFTDNPNHGRIRRLIAALGAALGCVVVSYIVIYAVMAL